MPVTVRSLLPATLLVSAAVAGHAAGVLAQGAAAPPDVISALLVEVRGLRAAMEQMASAGPRVQLALGRLQLQEQRVNTLVRRLEEIKARLPSAQLQLAEAGEQLNRFEKLARDAPDPALRREAEEMLQNFKRQTGYAGQEVQRLQTEETTLTQEIAAEQNRWTEFNQRLEELERALVRR
jgi:hypothetical protein